MDARAFDKGKLPSRHVTEGPSRALRRSHTIGREAQMMCALEDGGAGNADGLTLTPTIVPRTLENVKSDWDQEVVSTFAHPISAVGEVVGLQRSRAPEGATDEVADMIRLQFRGPAHVLDGHVLDGEFQAVAGRACGGEVAPIADGWSCGGTRRFCVGEVGPEAAVGGPIAVAIDARQGTFDLDVSEPTLAMRRTTWKAPSNPYQTGTLRKCADRVGPTRTGAVAHAGSRAEVVGYADI